LRKLIQIIGANRKKDLRIVVSLGISGGGYAGDLGSAAARISTRLSVGGNNPADKPMAALGDEGIKPPLPTSRRG